MLDEGRFGFRFTDTGLVGGVMGTGIDIFLRLGVVCMNIVRRGFAID